MTVSHGRVEYQGRAFEQDAVAAMRGDIVRALVELLTNSDDAYRAREGDIRVVVERTDSNQVGDDLAQRMPTTVRVHDRAGGLTAEEMTEKFGVLGGQNEGFMEGEDVRGLLGRGAKDVAGMGEVHFESVKDDALAAFLLKRTGDYELSRLGSPQAEDRDRLMLQAGDSGLTASVFVDAAHRVPRRTELVERLSTHVQLRHLLARRRVLLTDERANRHQPVVIEAPASRGEVLLTETLDLGPDYGTAQITLRRLPERSAKALSDHSEHGIVIAGTSSGYMNALFGQEGRPEAGWLAGEIVAPQIEELVRAYDRDERGPTNPMRLVARDRDGLVQEHPFFVALQDVAIRLLLPLLDALAKSESRGHKPGADLSRALTTAQQALAAQMREALKEIDEEEPVGPEPTDEVLPLSIVPPKLVLREGEHRSLSVRISGTEGRPFTASVTPDSPEGLIEVVEQSNDFSPHPRLDAMVSNFTVRAGTSLGTAKVRVDAEPDVAYAVIEVVPADEKPPVPVTGLQFERASYTMAPEKGRNLRILAPLDSAGETVEARWISGPEILVKDSAVLRPSGDGSCSECFIRVQSGAEQGTTRLSAHCAAEEASATVRIAERPVGQALTVELQLEDKVSASRRAWVEERDGTLLVRVYGGHPALKSVLGTYDEAQGQYRREDEPAARAVLAEAIGMALANFLVEREATRRPEMGWDASRVLNRQGERSSKLVPIAQAALKARGQRD